MKIACIIPARLHSSRFPKKILSRLHGKPLLQWVWDAASTCEQFDAISFAIDSQETADLISSFGGSFLWTSVTCASGTERLIEVSRWKSIQADIWVNWQGDEPFIHKNMIEDLLQSTSDQKVGIWSLKKEIQKREELFSTHVVKVVTDAKGRALYFSRSPIPHFSCEKKSHIPLFKHIGLYAFRSSTLSSIDKLLHSPLEEAEQLEQLKWLEHGLPIQLHTTTYDTIAIDTQEDLLLAEAYLDSIGDRASSPSSVPCSR